MGDLSVLKAVIGGILVEDETAPSRHAGASGEEQARKTHSRVAPGEIERAIKDMSFENLERLLKSGKNLVDLPHFFALSLIEKLIDDHPEELRTAGLFDELKRAETSYANAIKSVHDALLHVKQRGKL